jgi:hypothetical protein
MKIMQPITSFFEEQRMARGYAMTQRQKRLEQEMAAKQAAPVEPPRHTRRDLTLALEYVRHNKEFTAGQPWAWPWWKFTVRFNRPFLCVTTRRGTLIIHAFSVTTSE